MLRASRTVAISALVLLGSVGLAMPGAQAKGGEVGGEGSRYFLNDGWGATANVVLDYGRTTDRVYVGDWDGQNGDTLAARRGNTYYLKNSLTAGEADVVVAYGRADDTVLVGDWDGDGVETLAVRRGSTYYIKNSLTGGEADLVLPYGRADDTVLVGDWDADGTDTLAVRRGSQYYLKNSLTGGAADVVLSYGRADDTVLVGDWDADGADTLGVRRGNVYYLKNALTGGEADIVASYGRATDTTLVGDWDGDGTDTPGVRRVAAPAPPAAPTAASLLASLTVSAENGAGYDRSYFRHWTDADGDGCDTRSEVLQDETAVPVTYGNGCTVATGRWYSYYDAMTWTVASDVDIDHMVPLAEAWASGARDWTAARREAYANDLTYPGSLVAVTDNVNASKSDRDPAEWLPAFERCRYAIEWASVKYRWQLTIDPAEKTALDGQFAGTCGQTAVTVPKS